MTALIATTPPLPPHSMFQNKPNSDHQLNAQQGSSSNSATAPERLPYWEAIQEGQAERRVIMQSSTSRSKSHLNHLPLSAPSSPLLDTSPGRHHLQVHHNQTPPGVVQTSGRTGVPDPDPESETAPQPSALPQSLADVLTSSFAHNHPTHNERQVTPAIMNSEHTTGTSVAYQAASVPVIQNTAAEILTRTRQHPTEALEVNYPARPTARSIQEYWSTIDNGLGTHEFMPTFDHRNAIESDFDTRKFLMAYPHGYVERASREWQGLSRAQMKRPQETWKGHTMPTYSEAGSFKERMDQYFGRGSMLRGFGRRPKDHRVEEDSMDDTSANASGGDDDGTDIEPKLNVIRRRRQIEPMKSE
ncbi:hypothetical protein PHLCEN_2v2242 [Hermanssonia centrifuga]|uniref:Uncharacterized protein n=1 Tax=Hermanssonia centrifuga TaxID=98765 RepID=A0A2R6RPP5_9APHY|nr:hypothetical protein PHLCEN_2v2242 [Hermanssonia centrifuga]